MIKPLPALYTSRWHKNVYRALRLILGLPMWMQLRNAGAIPRRVQTEDYKVRELLQFLFPLHPSKLVCCLAFIVLVQRLRPFPSHKPALHLLFWLATWYANSSVESPYLEEQLDCDVAESAQSYLSSSTSGGESTLLITKHISTTPRRRLSKSTNEASRD